MSWQRWEAGDAPVPRVTLEGPRAGGRRRPARRAVHVALQTASLGESGRRAGLVRLPTARRKVGLCPVARGSV